MLGLDHLISPHDVQSFLQDQYGRKAILITGEPEKFDGLFGWEDVNYLSRYSQPQRGGQRLVMDKNSLTPSEFSNFAHWIDKGATFVINHLQTKHPALDDFARILSAELNTSVNINAYISSETRQGFDNHFDRHDVFIIQTAGVKHWKVFHPTLQHPLEYMQGPKGNPPESDPYIECDMSPGDVLYIPRGHWHYAVAKNSSIHLTVGPAARSPIDFLRWLVEKELWSNAAWRRDFPIAESSLFYGRVSDTGLDDFVGSFRKDLLDRLSGDRFLTLFKEFVMSSNPLRHVPRAAFPEQQLLKESITVDTVFQVPLGQKILLQYDDARRVGVIISRGVTIDVEDIDREVLAALFAGDPDSITGREVLDRFPDTSEDAIRNLLLQLVEQGVLELRV